MNDINTLAEFYEKHTKKEKELRDMLSKGMALLDKCYPIKQTALTQALEKALQEHNNLMIQCTTGTYWLKDKETIKLVLERVKEVREEINRFYTVLGI